MNLWQFASAQPTLFGVLYALTLFAAVFLVAGIAHEKTKRELAWAYAEQAETEAKVQVATLDLEKVKALTDAHAQYHQEEAAETRHAGHPLGIVR